MCCTYQRWYHSNRGVEEFGVVWVLVVCGEVYSIVGVK